MAESRICLGMAHLILGTMDESYGCAMLVLDIEQTGWKACQSGRVNRTRFVMVMTICNPGLDYGCISFDRNLLGHSLAVPKEGTGVPGRPNALLVAFFLLPACDFGIKLISFALPITEDFHLEYTVCLQYEMSATVMHVMCKRRRVPTHQRSP